MSEPQEDEKTPRELAEEDRAARVGDAIMRALETADLLDLEGVDRLAFVGRRAATEHNMAEIERRQDEALARKADLDEKGWLPVRPGTDKWLYKIKQNPADYTTRYRVKVKQRVEGEERWEDLGSEWASTRWGARYAAGKLVRRQLKRFGP